MNKTQLKKRLEDIDHDMSVENRMGDLRRARSVTVGTSFGGTTELMMRGNDSNVIWAVMQPVEVVELIHQLAANIGCHLMLKPREDFASWRSWKYTDEELKHYRHGGGALLSPGVGHPPHVNDMADHMEVGAKLPPPEQQPGMQPSLMAKDKQHETVATKKSQNRRSSKRTSAAA